MRLCYLNQLLYHVDELINENTCSRCRGRSKNMAGFLLSGTWTIHGWCLYSMCVCLTVCLCHVFVSVCLLVCVCVLSHEDMIWQYLPTHLFLFQHDVLFTCSHVMCCGAGINLSTSSCIGQ